MRLVIILMGVIVLSACAPSPSAIETAVAQTQAAIPTATPTPAPTPTPVPPTDVPKALDELLMAEEDFPADLGEFYTSNPIQIDQRINIDVGVESVSYYYAPNNAPRLIINLVRLEALGQRVRTNRLLKEQFDSRGDLLKLPTDRITLPEAVWAVATNDGWLVAGWYHDDIIVVMEWEKIPNREADTLAAALALFIQAQEKSLSR